jgi:hypothetical protein
MWSPPPAPETLAAGLGLTYRGPPSVLATTSEAAPLPTSLTRRYQLASARLLEIPLSTERKPHPRHWSRLIFGEHCYAGGRVDRAIRGRSEITHHEPSFAAEFGYVVSG